MTDLYTNLLKATSNIDDITTEKYGVITKLDGLYCSVKETDNDLEHNNVPIINGANLSVGDKVIIGFLNNSIYDVVCYGALDKTVHDDTKQDKLISGENIKTINHQSLLGSGNITIEGGGSDVDIVTSWEPTPSDTKVPSEKLTKNTLDNKVDKSSTTGLLKNDGTVDTTSYSTFSGSYNDLSGKPTIPSPSTTTPSADTTSGSYGSGTNYARSNHTHPKSSLYAEATHTHTKSQITDFPTIPTNTSDLTNDGADGTNVFVANNDSRLSDSRTPTSHTHGQITNAGTITSTAVTVASGDNIVITDASDSSKVKRVTNLLAGHIKDSTAHTNIGSSANDTQATINSDIDTALSNKVSKSSTSGLLKNDGSVDTTAYSTFDGNYNSLTNKPTIPTIPTNVSAFTNDVGYLTQHQSLANYIQKSSTSGLIKNDGTIDTTSYLSSLPSHTHDDRYYTESEMDTALNGKQATLISGTNIKTINNTSLLGSGNINIQGGGTVTIDDSLSTTSTNPVQNKVITGALNGKANSSHTHTKSEITDFPSIPSKTSDLVNDGDGSNVFVKDNDSRLSNARTPLAHTHLSSDVTDLIDVIYPVGSIYMSVNSTSPQTLFGGTWEQIKDTFLLASGDTYANGTTGGSADAVVVSHNHTTDRAYVLTTDGSGVSRISTAGQTGTKVSNLLQSADAIYRNQVNSAGESGTGKNMPPYLTVFVWKRTA